MPPTKAGRYELKEELGRGAMGVVYKAFDPMIRRQVAVKTMRLNEEGTGMARPELITRFQTEARAAGVLTHQNIVTVFDAGEEGGLFYITMEFVEGRSLQALLDQKQSFPTPRVLRIMEQACQALDFAHHHNIVHRDIKPANLMLTATDQVKVTDFGTAKIMQLGTTQTGSIIGTPSYMSPEQVKGKVVDGRSDIFSLGVILYELVTGEKPFPGQNVTTVIYKIVNEDPVPPRDLDSSVHPGLSYVITRALTKNVEQRYQTCMQMLEDLRNYRDLGSGPAPGPDPFAATVVMVGRPRLPSMAQTQVSVPPPPPPPAPQAATPPAAAEPPAPVPAQPAPRPSPSQRRPAPPQRVQQLPDLAEDREEVAPKQERRSSVWLILLLLAALGGGGYFVWNELQATLRPPEPSRSGSPGTQPPAAVPDNTPEKNAADGKSAEPLKKAGKDRAPAKEESASVARREDGKLRSRLEKRLADAGLGSKVRVQVSGNTVTLSGEVSKAEARKLQTGLRGVPSGVRVDNRVQIAGMSPAPAEENPNAENMKPRTSKGRGEVEVLADSGAVALLKDAAGKTDTCKTPCRFEDLVPGRYSLEVSKTGFRTERRIVSVTAGRVSPPQEIKMQAEASGFAVESHPEGAEVLINGQKQPGLTPTTVLLPPGTYDILVQKPGYVPKSRRVQLAANEVQKFTVDLLQQGGVGWLDVKTIPLGADVLLNDNAMPQRTPVHLDVRPGKYTVKIYLRGYKLITRQVEINSGQTITLNETFAKE